LVSFSVRNFGPIANADVELKPLTVFIGPNNSGKSYLGLAIYSISRALSGASPYMLAGRSRRAIAGYPYWRAVRSHQRDRRFLRDTLREFATDIEQLVSGEKRLGDMPVAIQALVEEDFNSIATSAITTVEYELQRCYGTDIKGLGRRGPQLKGNEIEIGIKDPNSGLHWEMRSGQERLITTNWDANLSSIGTDIAKGRVVPRGMATDPDYFQDIISSFFFQALLAGIAPASHYLPASRTGILQEHKTLASLIVGRASRAWLEPMEIPSLPGVVTDLIQALLLLGHPHKTVPRLRRVVEFLELNVTKGTVDINLHGDEYPEISYVNEAGKFQLHQVSSMVSEVAPMVLFLKYLIEPGDLFIIEEPESHIDAATQRNLASAIAMMVNAGVRVLVTTHSDFFLNQINNLTLVSQVSPRKRRAMGYKVAEALDSNDVAAYLFHPSTEGTLVESLEISPDFGIPTESFDMVHRSLYDETIKLEPVA